MASVRILEPYINGQYVPSQSVKTVDV
ncbi:MAG TPA: hypothetical protein PKE04_10270, partial [Clostridia bacterium]|nr:hypothetical protein [Clostridia bacterium]